MVDFLCIGAHKSGTSWLNNNLSKHPDIWTPPYKELHFFDELEFGYSTTEERKRKRWLSKYLQSLSTKVENNHRINARNLEWVLNFIQTPYEKRTFKWYADLFKGARNKYKLIGEITPAYALLTKKTYREIRKSSDDVKIIFIIRNPALRDWSSLRFDLLTNKKLSNTDTDKKSKPLNKEAIFNYLKKSSVEKRSNYLQTIKRIEYVFPKENIKYLFFDQIESNPYALMEDICDFLSIEFLPEYFPDLSEKRLISKEIAIDDDVLNYLKDKYKDMVEEIDRDHISIPDSWKSFFDL